MKAIEAILFDFGGTLRQTIKRDIHGRREHVQTILRTIGSEASPTEFERLLSHRYQAYRGWAKETLREANEEQLWTRWMLPDWPPEQVRALAHELNRHWREATGIRKMMPESKAVIAELSRRGYRLGIVSNTISTTELPRTLEQVGLMPYLQTVVLSSVFGRRKPDPAILLAATAQLGLAPEVMAYVGNRPNRDVEAAKRAGFGATIIVQHERKPLDLPPVPSLIPDRVIANLTELLTIFPAITKATVPPAA